MKYNIYVNQYAIVKEGIDIDIIDAAILDCMASFFHSSRCVSISDENGTYYWISHNSIIEDLPLINIKSKSGIKKRIEKLVNCKLLSIHPNSVSLGRSYYRIGPMFDKITFSSGVGHSNNPSPEKGETPTSEGRDPSPEKGEDYSTKYNTTSNNKEKTTKKEPSSAANATSIDIFSGEESKAFESNANKENKKNNRTEEEFEKVWKLYDKKGSKKLSRAKWMKLTDEEVNQCLVCIPKYMSAYERNFRKDLQAFINQKAWEGKICKFGKCIYDPDEAAEAVNLDIEPRGATSYPKGPDGIYITHNDHPVYGVIFDGYNDNNRPAGTKIRYCGLVYVWNPKISTFELENK